MQHSDVCMLFEGRSRRRYGGNIFIDKDGLVWQICLNLHQLDVTHWVPYESFVLKRNTVCASVGILVSPYDVLYIGKESSGTIPIVKTIQQWKEKYNVPDF